MCNNGYGIFVLIDGMLCFVIFLENSNGFIQGGVYNWDDVSVWVYFCVDD